ncbi:uncharacterized protein BT62DRAFT_928560 [Guyanagaster necrorhizus]|uniref:F-box domain-containing protein n=1 Tax=Guyanagaster necrorhizus TaxID=856835 RepID=A0A9P7W0J7_9AGAR|nr:uncharacterized protein BT62DRAFT_928560 [Guyanagaster necrorhizus MCA 3950]KAG7449820.1 hypothetical protein BT62DRAFT_928560 [Guyanagaster necrorhizus MCA 3950]
MTPLPPELVLEILRYLSNDFRACCLVCRAWRQLAQPFIFSALAVSLESHCQSWNRKFITYPHLAGYVTRLDMWGSYLGGQDARTMDQPPFLESAKTLEFVRRLPNVKHLDLEGFFLPSKREIKVLCQFTRLECLEMFVVVFNQPVDLLDLMSQLVNLKDLRLTGTQIRSPNKDMIGPALHNHVDVVPKRLRNLQLQDTTESLYIFSWLSGGAFDLCDLTDLTLSWECFPTRRHPTGPQASSYVDSFINAVGAGIKHLQLDIETLKFGSKSNINYMLELFISTGALSNFTVLETLDIDSISSFENDAMYLVDIERLLRSVTLTNLRKMSIVTCFTLSTPDHLPSYKELPVWASLDGLLSSPKFPSLQQLKFIIDVRCVHWKANAGWEDFDSNDDDAVPEQPPMVDDVAAMITEKMPTLTSWGCLTCCPAVIQLAV